MRTLILSLLITLSATLAAAAEETKPASESTRRANAAILRQLPFDDVEDFEDAGRGFIATLDPPVVLTADGRTVWDARPFDFEKDEACPDTVNPSLWRQARLNLFHGLFEVVPGVYQIRGIDIANMTIIEGDAGLILVDPLICAETAAAGLDLYRRHRDPKAERQVKAIVYTHSHGDHFGGAGGVIDAGAAASGQVAVIAPVGFLEEAVSENVFAGDAMFRRAFYMYGTLLPRGPRGFVDSGLGKMTPSGTMTLIPPNDTITATGETRTVDGIEMEFQLALDTEAPSEMLVYFPRFKALCAAEDATRTLHNLYTLRGAKVRDANLWWQALDEALALFGERADVVFAQHHWPTWGRENIRAFMSQQRDAYKYIHDQTLYWANRGLTPAEAAERVELPPALAKRWHLRGYYGTVNHDVKAVYQFYLGWYDSNPANLHPLPPAEAAKRYVEVMGGADAALAKARGYFAEGDYRFTSEMLKHLVFADPDNVAAKNLLADSFEQQGYQAESGPWRSEFLSAAHELRHGIPGFRRQGGRDGMTAGMTGGMLLSYLGANLNAQRAMGEKAIVNLILTDDDEKFTVTLDNSVIVPRKGVLSPAPDATLAITRPQLLQLVMGGADIDEIAGQPGAAVANPGVIRRLSPLFDLPGAMFPIATP